MRAGRPKLRQKSVSQFFFKNLDLAQKMSSKNLDLVQKMMYENRDLVQIDVSESSYEKKNH